MNPQEITVAIDIGHGNNTFEIKRSKFVIVDGVVYEEHDFNSKVGIELDKILQRHGFKTVVHQKPFSPEVNLTQRISYYNKIKVNLVVSIHANAGVKSADGLAAFYWHTSNSSKKLAQMYADEVGNYGYEKYGQGHMPSVPDTWSEFAMCRDTDMDAILTENGFMTNDNDFKLIFKSDKFVKDVAEIHAKAICRYYGVTYISEVAIAKEEKVTPVVTPKLEEVMNMKMSDFIPEGDMIRLETVYRYARADKFLSDDMWEKAVRDKSITVGQVAYLDALLDHRRYGKTKETFAEMQAKIAELEAKIVELESE